MDPPQQAAARMTWAMSGQGEVPITLLDAQQLALEAGFTFKGATEAMPLARRADLQAMFNHFGVNSLTAFRRKFWTYELDPCTPSSAGTSRHGACSDASRGQRCLPKPGGGTPGPRVGSGSGRSRWGVQQRGHETYVGGLLDGKSHGNGILLSKGARSWVLHVGRFSEGKRNGPGVVASSRGERFEGFFMDDVMWGPGQYTYAPPAAPGKPAPQCHSATDSSSSSGGAGSSSAEAVDVGAAPAAPGAPGCCQQQPHRVAYHGMMNGRPQGKGCMEWSDGSKQAGQYDGNNCYLRLSEGEVCGVLMVAADNASEARQAAAEVQQQAGRQPHEIAQQAQRLFASLAPPAETAAAGARASPLEER